MAANPVIVICTADTWVIIATAVTNGNVHRISEAPAGYSQTYRLTGGAAPADDTDAADMFELSKLEPISSDAAIDVYVKAHGAAGSVRVDL